MAQFNRLECKHSLHALGNKIHDSLIAIFPVLPWFEVCLYYYYQFASHSRPVPGPAHLSPSIHAHMIIQEL